MPELSGDTLRALRESRLMTQQELAELANLHVNHVGKLERSVSTVRPSTVRSLAKALGVPAGSLIVAEERAS